MPNVSKNLWVMHQVLLFGWSLSSICISSPQFTSRLNVSHTLLVHLLVKPWYECTERKPGNIKSVSFGIKTQNPWSFPWYRCLASLLFKASIFYEALTDKQTNQMTTKSALVSKSSYWKDEVFQDMLSQYSDSVSLKTKTSGMYFKASSLKHEIFVHVRMEVVAVIHLEGFLLERITTQGYSCSLTDLPDEKVQWCKLLWVCKGSTLLPLSFKTCMLQRKWNNIFPFNLIQFFLHSPFTTQE